MSNSHEKSIPPALNYECDIAPLLGQIKPVEGGFTDAKRGLLILDNGQEVFVKIGTSPDTKKWLAREIDVLRWLNQVGYEYAPQLVSVGSDNTAVAMESLSVADFGDHWDKEKMDAVLESMDALSKLKEQYTTSQISGEPPMGLDNPWPKLDLGKDSYHRMTSVFSRLGHALPTSIEELNLFLAEIRDFSCKKDSLIHGDIRADNFGYNPKTGTGKLVDWNWISIEDGLLDKTALFISMFKSGFNPYEYHPDLYDRKYILMMIGFWLQQLQDPSDLGIADRAALRKAQAESVITCLDMLDLEVG